MSSTIQSSASTSAAPVRALHATTFHGCVAMAAKSSACRVRELSPSTTSHTETDTQPPTHTHARTQCVYVCVYVRGGNAYRADGIEREGAGHVLFVGEHEQGCPDQPLRPMRPIEHG
jgi:hypothetical protein